MQPITSLHAFAALAAAKLALGQGVPCAGGLDGKLLNVIPSDFHFSGNVRTYYVQAEQGIWDYVPSDWDNWLGVPFEALPRASSAGYTKASGSLGTKWEKALYRGYTNASFAERTQQPSWQGVNGPTLRAEVGDIFQILFVNKLANNYASMHSMGLSLERKRGKFVSKHVSRVYP
jgi:FtsP/CotA-like multicopper oxidase with cupredoxin domain